MPNRLSPRFPHVLVLLAIALLLVSTAFIALDLWHRPYRDALRSPPPSPMGDYPTKRTH